MFGFSTFKLIGAGIGALAIAIFIGLAFHWKGQAADRKAELATICAATRNASNLPKLKCSEVPKQIAFLGDALNAVRVKTAEAKAADAAHAKEVEDRQKQASQETSRDYQAELARVRADYADRLRRAAARAADPGRSGNPSVPGPSAGAGRPDATAAEGGLPPEDALTATEQAIQLRSLQDWARKVGLAPAR